MDDLKFADFSFLSERLRRKSDLGLTPGIIAPMVNPYFVAYSFHLTGEEARQAAIQREFVREFDAKWGAEGYVSLEEGIHTDRLTQREDPLLLLELCEDTSLVRSIWGRGWRQHVLKLSNPAPFRASRLKAKSPGPYLCTMSVGGGDSTTCTQPSYSTTTPAANGGDGLFFGEKIVIFPELDDSAWISGYIGHPQIAFIDAGVERSITGQPQSAGMWYLGFCDTCLECPFAYFPYIRPDSFTQRI